MPKKHVIVMYGSRSPEHEISIITALQVLANLDQEKYLITPIYITKTGKWLLGDKSFFKPENYSNLTKLTSNKPEIVLTSSGFGIKMRFGIRHLPKIDMVMPIFHGPHGEDGTIQGLLESLNLPYTGSGISASAIGLDKILSKHMFSSANFPQVKYLCFTRTEWQTAAKNCQSLINKLNYPLYIKPSTGGSSIGTTKIKSLKELPDALDVALCYSQKVIIEESAEGFNEINISVLGNSYSELTISTTEQPIPSTDILTFSDKYESKPGKSEGMASASRLIPAKISSTSSQKISTMAKSCFQLLECSGVARIDFLVSKDEKTIYLNEVNTLPGSLSYYLWQPTGLSFPLLLDKIIELGEQRFLQKNKTQFSFPNNLLAGLNSKFPPGKLKG